MSISLVAFLSVAVAKEPPDEILFFHEGWNETQKGDFLFDEKAAKAVMAAFNDHGIECMVDLEHLSIDPDAPNYDPDARAWYKLEVRNGELWAVDVRWMPDGAERLKSGKQRYISPFFGYDAKTKRINSVFNAGLVAVPATNHTPALIAASLRLSEKLGNLPSEVKDMEKIYSALGLSDDATPEDALSAIKALTDSGGDGDEVMKKLRAALKLADDATEEDCMSALTKLADTETPPSSDDEKDKLDDEKQLSKLAKSNPKLYGEFMALRSNNGAVSARLANLEKKLAKNEVEELIKLNIKKLPLHMESWAKKQSVETLSSYFSVAQPVRKDEPSEPKGGASGNDEDPEQAKLTPADIKMAKLAKVPPELVLAERKKEIQKRRERMGLAN